MYRAQVGARVADGVASHGSVDAYIGDFHACSKAFEMFVADRLSDAEATGRRFLLWEDLDAATKEARGLTKADAGVDVTDGATTLVQCKLRARYLTWRECATFFASAVSFTDGAYHVPWRSLLLARNACSKLSRPLAELGASRPFDLPVPLSEFRAFARECLAEHESAQAAQAAQALHEVQAAPRQAQAQELRDYQVEAIELCVKETTAPAYVVLPTGCGKSLVMARVAAHEEIRVLIFVPLVALLEQMLDVLAADLSPSLRAHVTAVGGAYEYDITKVDAARVVVCVYNSAHKIDATKFDRVLIDEAHFARAPAIYTDLLDGETSVTESDGETESEATDASVEYEAEDAEEDEREDDEADAGSLSATTIPTQSARASRMRGYAAVRTAMSLVSARLFSATLDVPEGAERCTRTLREMIDAGRLCDYRLNVPVFDVGATNTDLARFLVQNHRSILVYCSTRAEGVSFCAAMNEHGPCARYIDCDTPRGERREILEAFKSGALAFVVNVRVLSVGFDAPITKGVCFVNMPASKTHIIQVIGRSLRVHPDKRCAQVILPLVAGAEGEDKRARGFMRVLAQTDTRVADALRTYRGAPYLSVRRVTRADANESDGSEEDEQSAAELLYTAVYDATGAALTDAWTTRFDELVAFYGANRTLPPQSTPGGVGKWVAMQRHRRATMPGERKARLDALGWWVWSVRAPLMLVGWDARFEELVAFYEANGRLPTRATPGLGVWVGNQRCARATMAPERKARLDALGWWVWDTRDSLEAAWSSSLDELVVYYEANGRLPPQSTPGGLGNWVVNQRTLRATMEAGRKARLDALQWWVWSVRAPHVLVGWDARFDELVAFYEANGRLPPQMTPGLGMWVCSQRNRRATMEAGRKARLDALQWWVWNPYEDTWSTCFDELVAFYEANGAIASRSASGGLGAWVSIQRRNRATMSTERKARLDALPWWVWRVRVRV